MGKHSRPLTATDHEFDLHRLVEEVIDAVRDSEPVETALHRVAAQAVREARDMPTHVRWTDDDITTYVIEYDDSIESYVYWGAASMFLMDVFSLAASHQVNWKRYNK